MMEIVSENQVIFMRGRRMRKTGKVSPPKPADDATGFEPHSILWIGYRVELAAEHARACAVAERLGMPRPDLKE